MTAWLTVKNNAQSALYAGITAAATSLTLLSGEGAKFPSASFNISIDDEILYCSTRTDDVLTVVRAQEGTTAAVHAIAATVSLNITAGIISQIQDAIDAGGGGISDIDDFLDDTPVDGEVHKAPSSNALYDTNTLVNAHASRHKWGGADPLNIKDLLMDASYPFYNKNWLDIAGFTASHTNTGSFTVGFIFGQLATGATTNSRACLYSTTPALFYNNNSNYYSRFMIRLNPITTMTNLTAWFGCLTNPTAPTATENHIAFKIVDGEIWASCGNGTNGNLVDTGVAISQYSIINLYYKQIGTTIYFYVNDVLKVTMTTYVPGPGPSVYLTMYMLNSAAENKNIYVYPMYFMLGSE